MSSLKNATLVTSYAMAMILVPLLVGSVTCFSPIQETAYHLPQTLLNHILWERQQQSPDLNEYAMEPTYLNYIMNSQSPAIESKAEMQVSLPANDIAGMFNELDMTPEQTIDQNEAAADILRQADADPRELPSLRDAELLQHSSLWGSQYVAGGAGEGEQHLGPGGVFDNKLDSKSDSILPAYCDPPNPCPPGYTAENGCLEDFFNSAAFSRGYQEEQQCMCDTEHMFACPQSTPESEITTLARRLAHIGVTSKDISNLMGMPKTKVVAKKYQNYHHTKENNPYLGGEKLSVAAKKGFFKTNQKDRE